MTLTLSSAQIKTKSNQKKKFSHERWGQTKSQPARLLLIILIQQYFCLYYF